MPHASLNEIMCNCSSKVDMASVGRDIRAESFDEPRAHVFPSLKAFPVDVRPKIGIVRSGRLTCRTIAVEQRQAPHSLAGDAANGAAPAGMNHGKPSRRRHDDDRDAVSEAQESRHLRNSDDQPVGTRLGPHSSRRDGSGIARRQIDEHVAMHLARNDKRRVRRAEGLKQHLPVFSNLGRVVANMAAKVERIVGRIAHSPFAPRKRYAHPHGLKQRVIGERRNATRAKKARVHVRFRQSLGRGHGCGRSQRWRFRKSGM